MEVFAKVQSGRNEFYLGEDRKKISLSRGGLKQFFSKYCYCFLKKSQNLGED